MPTKAHPALLSHIAVCAQIRLAGLKGVLALNPRLAGKALRYRPSQEKFGSTHSVLEVVSLGMRIAYHLNRWVPGHSHSLTPNWQYPAAATDIERRDP